MCEVSQFVLGGMYGTIANFKIHQLMHSDERFSKLSFPLYSFLLLEHPQSKQHKCLGVADQKAWFVVPYKLLRIVTFLPFWHLYSIDHSLKCLYTSRSGIFCADNDDNDNDHITDYFTHCAYTRDIKSRQAQNILESHAKSTLIILYHQFNMHTHSIMWGYWFSPLADVSVGFLDSQRVMFNESDDTIFVTLTKNATTAQKIQVNLTFPKGKPLGTIIDGLLLWIIN